MTPPAADAPPGRASLAPPVVIVAEDDRSLRELIVGALSRRRFHPLPVEDGVRAREEILRHRALGRPVSLLITDVQMPRYTGMELLTFLGSAPDPIPVIVTSSFMSPELRREAMLLGAKEVFSKPFDLHQLMTAVERIVGT